LYSNKFYLKACTGSSYFTWTLPTTRSKNGGLNQGIQLFIFIILTFTIITLLYNKNVLCILYIVNGYLYKHVLVSIGRFISNDHNINVIKVQLKILNIL
jgi:hypothetical protein